MHTSLIAFQSFYPSSQETQCDFTPVSCLSDCGDTTNYQQHYPLGQNEWFQQQASSLLPPALQVFSSTVSPPASSPSPPTPLTGERVRYDSGINMQLSQETDVEREIVLDSMLLPTRMIEEVECQFNRAMQAKDEEVAALRVQVAELERQLYVKNTELKERDKRLHMVSKNPTSYDGSMIWKISQFNQRKAEAVSGEDVSILSLPFYSGRYGYKMCLRLYIMGDGIGKGTHLSLFFVVMRGEFDNILQWPFTHKVTFKLINQAGGRDVDYAFQPDPQSSSFRKPKSDMNIASGCPQFVSHTKVERDGFIVDDAIFIKCIVDTNTIRHP